MDWAYLFLSFRVRISRKPYWIASCFLIAAARIIQLLNYYLNDTRWGNFADLALLYPDFSVLIKRAHDRDIAYWMPTLYLILSILLSIISILGLDGPFDNPNTLYLVVALPCVAVALYPIVDLGFRKGTPGPNRFGPDPLVRQA
jgi:uncharacterized membrane protein YhaH (DUF805 family)